MSTSPVPDAVPAGPAEAEISSGQRTKALVFATLGFTVTFWAWSLISPLGPHFVAQDFTDNSSLLVAVPVLVGSLGRILVGSLTDRLGGRFMMPFIALVSVFPVLFVGFIGQYTYPALLIGGLFLGIAGTSFAVGVPYVNRWFPPQRRGMAIGVYGIGTGGTAIAAFTTVPLHDIWPKLPFVLAAAILIIYAVVAYAAMRNPPDWKPSTQSLVQTTAETMRIKLTWQACYLYALTFGGYVAFSVYLPTMLHNNYGLEPAHAALRMAGFVVVAVVLRPVGGGLSDRFGAIPILSTSYSLILVCALALAFDPGHIAVYTAAYILMSAGLGMGAGATFALIAQHSDPAKIGSITGFVGAAGGLGGFIPPLLLGGLWSALGSYSIGLILLGGTTIIALLITIWVGREAKQRRTALEATP